VNSSSLRIGFTSYVVDRSMGRRLSGLFDGVGAAELTR